MMARVRNPGATPTGKENRFRMKMPPLRSLTTTNALIALWLVLTCNVTFYEQLHQYTPFTGWRAFAFLGSAHVLLWAYIHLFLQLVTWGRLARPLLSWILLSSALAAYFVDVYGVSIDAGQIQNMMETDLREVVDLLGWHMAGYIVMLALPPLLWLWWRPLVKTTFWRSQGRRLAAILLSLGLIGGVAALFYADYASIFRNHREIRLVINPHNYINGLRGYYKSRSLVRKPLLPYGHDARRDPPARATSRACSSTWSARPRAPRASASTATRATPRRRWPRATSSTSPRSAPVAPPPPCRCPACSRATPAPTTTPRSPAIAKACSTSCSAPVTG